MKIIYKLILVFAFNFTFSQNSESKISLIANLGISNTLVNSTPKQNQSNSYYGIDINYDFYKGIYVGAGYKYNEVINVNNIAFNSYEIPLYFGSNINVGESISKSVNFNIEAGGYMRDVLNAPSTMKSEKSFGYSIKIGTQIDLTKAMFVRISYLRQFENSKIFENEKIGFDRISSINFSFGFKL
jgi:opacity protein-like surface antigen